MSASIDGAATLHRVARVLALEPGRACGFAAGYRAGMLSGTWSLAPVPGYSTSERLHGYLDDVHASLALQAVILRGQLPSESANPIRRAVGQWASANSLPLLLVDTGTVNENLIGRRQARRVALVDECKSRKIGVRSEPEAVAVALLDWAFKQMAQAA